MYRLNRRFTLIVAFAAVCSGTGSAHAADRLSDAVVKLIGKTGIGSGFFVDVSPFFPGRSNIAATAAHTIDLPPSLTASKAGSDVASSGHAGYGAFWATRADQEVELPLLEAMPATSPAKGVNKGLAKGLESSPGKVKLVFHPSQPLRELGEIDFALVSIYDEQDRPVEPTTRLTLSERPPAVGQRVQTAGFPHLDWASGQTLGDVLRDQSQKEVVLRASAWLFGDTTKEQVSIDISQDYENARQYQHLVLEQIGKQFSAAEKQSYGQLLERDEAIQKEMSGKLMSSAAVLGVQYLSEAVAAYVNWVLGGRPKDVTIPPMPTDQDVRQVARAIASTLSLSPDHQPALAALQEGRSQEQFVDELTDATWVTKSIAPALPSTLMADPMYKLFDLGTRWVTDLSKKMDALQSELDKLTTARQEILAKLETHKFGKGSYAELDGVVRKIDIIAEKRDYPLALRDMGPHIARYVDAQELKRQFADSENNPHFELHLVTSTANATGNSGGPLVDERDHKRAFGMVVQAHVGNHPNLADKLNTSYALSARAMHRALLLKGTVPPNGPAPQKHK